MSLPYFPFTTYQVTGGLRGLTWPVMKTAEFDTTMQTSPSFQTVRIQNAVNPRWHWTQIWNYLKDNPNDLPSLYAPFTDYQTMQGFYNSVGGMNGAFLLSDPVDNYVGPALKTAAWRANWTPIAGAIIVVT